MHDKTMRCTIVIVVHARYHPARQVSPCTTEIQLHDTDRPARQESSRRTRIEIEMDRRRFLEVTSASGCGALFPGVLWALAQPPALPGVPPSQAPSTSEPAPPRVTRDMIDAAAAIAGVVIADDVREAMIRGLTDNLESYEQIHALALPNEVPPVLVFDPVPAGMSFEPERRPLRMSRIAPPELPRDLEDVAFYSVRQLAELVRERRISSVDLTEMYLARLKRYDPMLHFVITFTEDRARAQAREADREIAAGRYRGPLHGLPWGAKDLLAVKGYPTTWGAAGFEEQVFDRDATVVERLDRAGAVLVAKLTLGALAMGDVWFGGTTRNPWRTRQGSSGSSAGSGSAVAAGCVVFAIGSETLGSISSPASRSGVTGLRPTFGRVPGTGAMALTWSMDKLGPMCRAVEDCAIVLDAIHGPDGRDRAVRDVPLNWDGELDPRTLRVGFLRKEFDEEPSAAATPEMKALRELQRPADAEALNVLRARGIRLQPAELPDLPWSGMLTVLESEAAAAFDELTRSGRDRLLTAQGPNDWPNIFRVARFVPAVEYVNANRARMRGIQAMAKVFSAFDVIVAPTTPRQLIATNLTGHPAVILPNGFRPADTPEPPKPTDFGGPNTPMSLTFIGQLFGEAKLLAVAKAYQDATDWHLRRPPIAYGGGGQ
jgi:Asp-tRNA(Asn)/Glu-tRNA(Gln) amidotransferase A subunit family amidase